ncbi:MAG: efflux RND transporter periplasmic adaptor subunit [Thermodesulfobacteriota bacterium]
MSSVRFDTFYSGRPKKLLVWVVVVIAAFGVGYWASGPRHQAPPATDEQVEAAPATKTAEVSLWTCAMHPQIKLPKPGKCPICFMDLIPLSTKEDEQGQEAVRYTMSAAAKRLAEVETAEVKHDHATVTVAMVGMVYEDETRVAALTSRVDGRLDEIYVNFTGVHVTKGDPMVKIWSPTLIKGQVELFETIKTSGKDEAVIKGAEEKLMQQGLTPEQIEKIKEKKKPDLYITLKAPISGTVMQKSAILGQFVKEGTEMYMINDLSRVWIKMDAYETDMPWIRFGQDVTFTTPSVPGRQFKGQVLFIEPTLDLKTRSVKIRVDADNPDLALRPGMFVSAQLEAEVDQKGRVIKPDWVGKYICPVRPGDAPSSEPGPCPITGLQLLPATAYGYADDPQATPPLVIPASAPLITGKRSVVYVEVPNAERPTYELREVTLGPRAGDKYLVYDGLKEGERVVTRGNFKIDSAMQIIGRPSMMNVMETKKAPETTGEEVVEKLKAPEAFLKSLNPLITEYLTLKDALVEAKPQDAGKSAEKLGKLLTETKADGLEGKSLDSWKSLSETMAENLKKIGQTQDIAAQRKAFDPLSEAFARVLMGFGHAMKDTLFVFYCPMAFDGQGAHWVEGSEDRRNPYFGRTQYKGQDMFKCGELAEKIAPASGPRPESKPTPAPPAAVHRH